MTIITTPEADLHAAIAAAGDLAAYAALQDLYLEAGAADAARAVARLAGGRRWPARIRMMDRPAGAGSLVWILGLEPAYGPLGPDPYARARLADQADFLALCRPIPYEGEESTRYGSGEGGVYERLAAGLGPPVRNSCWAYFASCRQALDHMGRALETPEPTV